MSHLNNLISMLSPQGAFAANLHLTGHCNMDCTGCFARFGARDQHRTPALRMSIAQWIALIEKLVDKTAHFPQRKLTFVGGEPLLIKDLPMLLSRAQKLGFRTCVVTNGTLLEHRLEEIATHTHWIGLSVDSVVPDTLHAIGRHVRNHTLDYVKLAGKVRNQGIRLKVNTVVSSLNYQEDIQHLVQQLAPERWKVLRWLPLRGENDTHTHMAISDHEFASFVARHAHLDPVTEDNGDMYGSYIMIDPEGWLLDNSDGSQQRVEPILEAITTNGEFGFSPSRFAARGGIYDY